jgi:hypothetical protein
MVFVETSRGRQLVVHKTEHLNIISSDDRNGVVFIEACHCASFFMFVAEGMTDGDP